MSVIFQTLKKLRNAPYEDHQKGLLRKIPGLYGFRKSLVPVAVLGLFILGIVAMYGTRVLGNYLTKDPKPGATTMHSPKTSGLRAEYLTPTENEPPKRFSASLANQLPKKETDSSDAFELANAFPDKGRLSMN